MRVSNVGMGCRSGELAAATLWQAVQLCIQLSTVQSQHETAAALQTCQQCRGLLTEYEDSGLTHWMSSHKLEEMPLGSVGGDLIPKDLVLPPQVLRSRVARSEAVSLQILGNLTASLHVIKEKMLLGSCFAQDNYGAIFACLLWHSPNLIAAATDGNASVTPAPIVDGLGIVTIVTLIYMQLGCFDDAEKRVSMMQTLLEKFHAEQPQKYCLGPRLHRPFLP